MSTAKNEKETIVIEREDGPTKGRYVVRKDGVEAEMTYSKAGDKLIIIDHTGVPDAFRGMGVGALLVRRGVEDARKEGKKIVPLCPFAKSYIEQHPELQDVVKK